VADASLTARSPFDEFTEAGLVILGLAGRAGFAFSRYGNGFHAEGCQLFLDGGLAVAAVRGDRPGWFANPAGDALHRGYQLRAIGRVAFLEVVVEHDAVFVIHDLGFVAEFDRFTKAAFGDRGASGRAG
jgi:hypothetical protein